MRLRRPLAVAGALLFVACGIDVVGGKAAPGTGVDAGGASASTPDAAGDAAGDPAAPPCVKRADGIVGWWPAEGTMVDISGHELHGISGTKGGATAVKYTDAGVVGRAFALDGKSFMSVSFDARFDLAKTVTVEAWIFANSLGGRILDHHSASVMNGYMLDSYQGRIRFLIGDTIHTGPELPTGRWTHVAGTFNGQRLRVYIDGQPAGSTPRDAGIPTTAELFRVGADSDGMSRFDGLIDEPTLYDRALTDDEVLAIFSAGRSGRCRAN